MKKLLALFVVCLTLTVVGCSGDEKKPAGGTPTGPAGSPTKTP